MAELIDRYVHHVGLLVPRGERAEIEAELRSQIYDRLDDCCGDTPTEVQIAGVLTDLGHPQKMAAAYSAHPYLISPDLYPTMMTVLRFGALTIPLAVLFLNLFGALTATNPPALAEVVLGTAFAAVQFMLIFLGVVVLVFALIQRMSAEIQRDYVFNPLDLSIIDDPTAVDRVQEMFGIVLGVFFTFVLARFAYLGGLTLDIGLAAPASLIPAPVNWMLILMALIVGMTAVSASVLRRGRWNAGLWMFETLLELLATVAVYFVAFMPLMERILASPSIFDGIPFARHLPMALAVFMGVVMLTSRGARLNRMWNK